MPGSHFPYAETVQRSRDSKESSDEVLIITQIVNNTVEPCNDTNNISEKLDRFSVFALIAKP